MSVMNRPYCMDRQSQSAYLNLRPSYNVLCPRFMPLGINLDDNYNISTDQCDPFTKFSLEHLFCGIITV
jgi:hypothetical protein